jgi:hypothetical protein
MSARGVTAAVIFFAAAVLVGYDLWALVTPAPGDTLSEVMRDAGPPAAFATGWLAGHFFLQGLPRLLPHWVGLLLGSVLCAGVSLLVADFPRPWDSVLALCWGVGGGAVLWPLQPRGTR